MPDDTGGRAEKRVERRISVALPVSLDEVGGFAAVTRDVSASGLFLETDAELVPGSVVRLIVELDTPAGSRILKCHGNVVRVERLENRLGFGVKLSESTLLRPQ